MTESEKNLELYLEKYCQGHRITPEEAKKHQLVRDTEHYYKEEARLSGGN